MMNKRIYKYILLFISSVTLGLAPVRAQRVKVVENPADSMPLIVGGQVFANLAGIVLWQASDYGEIEGGLKVNMKGKYFPTIEVGLGICDKTNDETDLHYKTTAPFVRIGGDYNFARDLKSGNRIYGGLRLGYSSFKYDLDGPAIKDPYWTDKEMAFNFKNQKSNAFWAEIVFGLETHIWKKLHLGWTARYKRRLSQKSNETGPSWYIPGYGENDGHLFTGTFNIIWDINLDGIIKKFSKSSE